LFVSFLLSLLLKDKETAGEKADTLFSYCLKLERLVNLQEIKNKTPFLNSCKFTNRPGKKIPLKSFSIEFNKRFHI